MAELGHGEDTQLVWAEGSFSPVGELFLSHRLIEYQWPSIFNQSPITQAARPWTSPDNREKMAEEVQRAGGVPGGRAKMEERPWGFREEGLGYLYSPQSLRLSFCNSQKKFHWDLSPPY